MNSGDPGDSGFGMEDVASDTLNHHHSSNVSLSPDNELSCRWSVTSDSDYTVSSRSNLSDVDDTIEQTYLKTMAHLNSRQAPVVRINKRKTIITSYEYLF